MNRFFHFILLGLFIGLAGCATRFPNLQDQNRVTDGISGPEVFEHSLKAHGGDLREVVNEISYAITGEWGSLITKIQPLVTDFRYRIASEEKFRPGDGFYRVQWKGPAGIKVVERTEESVRVWYDGQESLDVDVRESSSMTSDAFQLFHFGPSFLLNRGSEPRRLEDLIEKGRQYYRLYFEVEPGFGNSARDEVVAWIDKETHLLYRVWITLEGFKTTRGASVDVTFLEYETKQGITLPTRFIERVRSPIRIKAHSWECVEWDVDLK